MLLAHVFNTEEGLSGPANKNRSISLFTEEYAVSYRAYLLEDAAFRNLAAFVSRPLHSNYMRKNSDAILKISLGLEAILFSPSHSIYGIGPNITCKSNYARWPVNLCAYSF